MGTGIVYQYPLNWKIYRDIISLNKDIYISDGYSI